jgi:hypothetical protein
MMLPLLPVEVASYTASFLTFLGFGVGLASCWRSPALRTFFLVMLSGYTGLYGVDLWHGRNPLALIVPVDAPCLIYVWAPVVRQMWARWIICVGVYSLILAYKLQIPVEEDSGDGLYSA